MAIIAPDSGFEKVKSHLESLLYPVSPSTEKEYLKDYPGFDAVYNKHLVTPNSVQSEYVVTINIQSVSKSSAIQFYEHIKRSIDVLSLKRNEIDCVADYIPNTWKKFR